MLCLFRVPHGSREAVWAAAACCMQRHMNMYVVQAFVGGEAGLEGAGVPGERASKGVTFDSRRFWAELGDAL